MGTERLFLSDDAATAALGQRLAAELMPGDVVRLAGDLGAGKTALARAIIRALLADPAQEVPSPSFALVQPYSGNGRSVLHADLYRLSGPDEVEELGLFDDPQAIVLIEWAERAEALLPAGTWRVTLSIPGDGNGRIAEIVR